MSERNDYEPIRRRSRLASLGALVGSAVLVSSSIALATEIVTKSADSVPRLVPFQLTNGEMWGDVVGDALEQNAGKLTLMAAGGVMLTASVRRKTTDYVESAKSYADLYGPETQARDALHNNLFLGNPDMPADTQWNTPHEPNQ